MTRTALLTAAIALASPAAAHLSPTAAEGDITRQEAVARADRLFDALDTNHDGLVTPSEAMIAGARLRAERARSGIDAEPGIGGHTERFLEHRFAGEHAITRSTFEAGMLAHFDRMDRNHDGLLTPDERAEAGIER